MTFTTKPLSLASLFILASSVVFSQKFAPPGTVPISEAFFADESEVTNISWKEYLYWIAEKEGETSEAYAAALPDTTVWQGAAETMNRVYFWHPAYESYPVVGINHEQATAYCKWRTERVKEMLMARKENRSKTYIPQDFSYRLPFKE